MKKNETKLIAFYLPQFHINPINNSLWGDGFTEWTNVAQARPNFAGHYQPHIPGKLGFYDLSFVQTLRAQVALAKQYGLYGFCFYYYWFDGQRALELPLDNFLSSEIDFPFCLCWANENWSRKWDGGNDEVVLKQSYGEEFEAKFVSSIESFLKDKRYILHDGKPVLIIYRPSLFRDPKRSLSLFRKAAQNLGFSGLHLLVVDFYLGLEEAQAMGADGVVEFPPHQFYDHDTLVDRAPGRILNKEYKGHLLDYRKFISRSLTKWLEPSPLSLYRGIIPSWDNTARRKNTSVTVVYNSPKLYEAWLTYLLKYSEERNSSYLFINAWNEWGEGCHLEPDRKDGLAYLTATQQALIKSKNISLEDAKNTLRDDLSQELASSLEIDEEAETTQEKQIISFKDFLRSQLFRYPRIFNLCRKIYKKVW